ncbi:MAG TPA: NUDIX domain-containing protein [Jatrophihabitans sp.]|jgi:8-oxo-dGTP diphosphatase
MPKPEAIGWPSYPHEVLAAVLSVRRMGKSARLCALLWQRTHEPFTGAWALPGGGLPPDLRLRDAILAHLATKVEVKDVAYLEQLATHSVVTRDPRARVLATAYVGLVPTDVEPALPEDTAWHPVDDLPATAFDHHYFVAAAVDRLRAKLSYTNIGFALAPEEFTIAELRDVTSAALGYQVSATNLVRVLTRRAVIEPTTRVGTPGRTGGRPAALYRFVSRRMTVTDPFAVLKPPRAREA